MSRSGSGSTAASDNLTFAYYPEQNAAVRCTKDPGRLWRHHRERSAQRLHYFRCSQADRGGLDASPADHAGLLEGDAGLVCWTAALELRGQAGGLRV